VRHRGPAALRGVQAPRGRSLRPGLGHTVNVTEKVAPLESAPAEQREQDFARHLRRAGELIGAHRLPEGGPASPNELGPADAAVRRTLGLIALKLDWFEEAISELESATRLAPEDQRAWSYLGY